MRRIYARMIAWPCLIIPASLLIGATYSQQSQTASFTLSAAAGSSDVADRNALRSKDRKLQNRALKGQPKPVSENPRPVEKIDRKTRQAIKSFQNNTTLNTARLDAEAEEEINSSRPAPVSSVPSR